MPARLPSSSPQLPKPGRSSAIPGTAHAAHALLPQEPHALRPPARRPAGAPAATHRESLGKAPARNHSAGSVPGTGPSYPRRRSSSLPSRASSGSSGLTEGLVMLGTTPGPLTVPLMMPLSLSPCEVWPSLP